MFIVHYALRALLRSPRRTFTGIFGTLLAIGLLSSVLLFVGASEREMTLRTIANVPVDLRAQALTYDLDLQAVETMLKRQKGIVDAQPFTLSHFSASSFSRDQKSYTTGSGAIVAVNESYLRTFPVIKLVQGSLEAAGVVLSQDMGTNLGARVGDTITLQLPGTGPDYSAKVTGIANLRDADTLFAPTDPKLQGVAFNPPANVVILPLSVFEAQLASRLKNAPPPDQSITTGGSSPVVQESALAVDRQIHLKVDRTALAGDPTQAQLQTTQLRLALEKLYPNQIRVSDDLFAAIEAVKADVLWAQVLFVFLALPGILLAAYLARYAVETLVENQRREFALLRARGASGRQVLGIVATMSLAVGLAGSVLGILIGAATTGVLFGMQPFALSNWPVWGSVLVWCVLAGLVISAVATFLPARRLLREEVIGERRVARREGAAPLGARLYLDVAALVASAIVFRVTELNGFHPVLNAEGNPTSRFRSIPFSPRCYSGLARSCS